MAEHIHFVTGKLAERTLRTTLTQLAEQTPFRWSLQVLPISVAALMSPEWIAQRIDPPKLADRVMIPGYCHGDLSCISAKTSATVERGPQDLRRLPEYFGRAVENDSYGDYDIEIIAEINHAPRMSLTQILQTAQAMRSDGADLIDVGCDPGEPWTGVGDCVSALRAEGHRVSIDSLNPREIDEAVRAGVELVLSVNSSNRQAASGWGCEVVVIPDDPEDYGSMLETARFLRQQDVAFRLDPILCPIGAGFAASLGRYLDARKAFPDCEIMMGVGNLTELTDADSAAINVLLLGFCQEIGVRSVLTTQVISWAASSVRELDLARRLVRYSVDRGIPPKHVEPLLVLLRDSAFVDRDDDLTQLADSIKDNNYRLFAQSGEVHLVSCGLHLHNVDPFRVFADLLEQQPPNLDASHAFYLGFEMSKALTALTLGKQYEQDAALDWGLLTRVEDHHRLRRTKRSADEEAAPGGGSPDEGEVSNGDGEA
jgi:dihydropteroate synthase